MSTVTAITPNLGAVGDSVTITGTGFGAAQGGSTVSFGGVAVASYTSWSDTSIVVVVPASTVSARVVVTVSGAVQTSYAASWFEVIDTAQRAVSDLKGQDETNDSSPEDYRAADARDYNNLLHLYHNSLDVSRNDFRLSLTTALSVTTSDVTGATTIYLTPHKGNRIALPATSTASVWAVFETAEVSLALGTLTADKNYDIFAYWSGSAVVLEALAWTSDTARATALVRTKGVYLKTGSLTRRYVGTFRTTSTTTTEDSLSKRFLFNADNRVARKLLKTESTVNWTYSSATVRSMNNSTSNRVEVLLGLAEHPVYVEQLLKCNANGGNGGGGIGIGSTTTNSADLSFALDGPSTLAGNVTAKLIYSQPVGYQYYQALESGGAAPANFYGAISPNTQSGLLGSVFA